jgi:hypothetical protein
MADHLLAKEVLRSVRRGNKKAAFCSYFAIPNKPSDGLEPSTPSLPSSNKAASAGKRGSRRPKKSRKSEEAVEDE